MACGTQELDTNSVAVAPQALALADVNIWTPSGFGNKTAISVCFTSAVTEGDRQLIREGAEGSWEAIDDFLDDTRFGVDFVGWETCPDDPRGLFVSIDNQVPGATSGSRVGRGGINTFPTMRFASSDLGNSRTVAHEFGHLLGFSHEYTRADYEGQCGGADTSPAKVGLTSADATSILNYDDCGSANRLTTYDIIGFSGVYGPTRLAYSSWLDNSSGMYALHDGGSFIDASGNPSALSSNNIFIVMSTLPTASAAPVHYGDIVSLLAKDDSYPGDYLLEGRETGEEVMVQELVTLTKISGPPESNLPIRVRFIGVGVNPVTF
jgi:hypothetical protein